MTLSSSMSIAHQALMVNQAALNVVSNNIANMNTEGYTRLKVNLADIMNMTSNSGGVYGQIASLGGVEIKSISRYADEYLENYFREQNTQTSYLSQAQQVGASVESIMNELSGTGLEALFTSFYEASNNLNLNPTDSTARINYAEQAKLIAKKFNSLTKSLTDMQESLIGNASGVTISQSTLGMSVADLNSKLESLAKINFQIIQSGAGDTSSSSALLDSRNSILNEISNYVPISTYKNVNNTIDVSLNGVSLISGIEVTGELSVKTTATPDNPIQIMLTDKDGVSKDITSSITSGSIGALIDATSANSDVVSIVDVQNSLNTLANEFAEILNTVQLQSGAMCIDTSSTTLTLKTPTEAIYVSSDADPINAGNITINSNITSNPYEISAAKVDPLDYDPLAVGNGNNMLDVLASRTANYVDLNFSSPEGYLTSLVGNIGILNESTKTELSNQELILDQVSSNLSGISGVNIDEELVDLIKYQRAYEASARIFSVCSELMDVLVNLGA